MKSHCAASNLEKNYSLIIRHILSCQQWSLSSRQQYSKGVFLHNAFHYLVVQALFFFSQARTEAVPLTCYIPTSEAFLMVLIAS